MSAAFESRLKAQALGLGFDLAGITTLGPMETAPAFEEWIAAERHGEMDYLRRGAELRADTRQPEPGMISALVVALDYGGRQPSGPIARYARGDDYHRVMWDKLDELLAWVRAERGEAVRGRAYVDTGPILERDLARQAGLGWIGKNTMLIDPRMGSFFFIGSLFLELDLVPDAPFAEEHCGTCTRCLDACPTQAFVEPGMLDARRCISYLTIESRSGIPEEFQTAVGEHLYGCDACQDVCPWNVRFARTPPSEGPLAPRQEFAVTDATALAREILALDETAYRARFRGSAMKRAKLSGLQRNAAVVLRRGLGLALLVLGAGGALACTQQANFPTPVITPPIARPSLPTNYRATGRAAAGDVFVHLFEWRWNDIATECESVLGPAGFKAVQVSPPQEHSLTPSRDWSERYQPVSYSLARSRSGTGAEFQSMVDRCATVGVGIYVDAVINHMTNFPSPGVGSNGTAYTKYSYPGLWTPADFHPTCTVSDYSNAANVQDCELFTLPDLNTGLPAVRQKLADYLIAIARMGVAGFRVDAAKHMQQVELDDILDRVNAALAAESRPLPYVVLEVGIGSGEVLTKNDYFGVGYGTGGASDITEFTFTGVADKFRKVGGQSIAQLDPNGPSGAQFSPSAWGLMPSDKAVVFLQNHDTQHNCGISPADGDAYRLANVWMLAQPYGYPSVLSSYAFTCPSGNSMGPVSDPDGWTLPVTCAASWETATPGQWICEHRDPSIARMVGFRKRVAGTALVNWWDNDANAIAFSRGDKGFVAINREAVAVNVNATTTLAPGTYCDLITGGRSGASCVGTSVTVAPGGIVQFSLPADRAVAIDISTIL